MNLDNAEWLSDWRTQKVLQLLASNGHRALVVGGCVRNAILGVPVADIDVATSALPDEVASIFELEDLKVVPTGIAHGTVTVVVDRVPFEVTTFRRDVETDGRRAVVAFTEALEEDARRRDFSMNAIYAEANGEVVDPLDGLPDLNARRVRFIEDADLRIREDYLRSLRFFRFHAQYGDPDTGLDEVGLAAIADNLEGLTSLSSERVGGEMRKLLLAEDPAPALAAMQATGALQRILPGAESSSIAQLVHLEKSAGLAPDFVRRLTVLGGEDPEARFRLTRAEEKSRTALVSSVEENANPAEIAWRLGKDAAWNAVLVRHALAGIPLDNAIGDEIEKGACAEFPVSAEDIMSRMQGAALGRALKKLERAWIDSGFALTRRELLLLLGNQG